jgi:pimeloyl-ACP methyl ester carboxylesterase
MPVTYHATGLVLTEHELEVPLDHADPAGERITVFAREVADPDGRDRPFLVFLAGGPGFEAPRPAGAPSGFIGRALRDYRVLLLDQRGTGRSTPIGDLADLTPQQQADYFACFRADSIVRDAEALRAHLGVDTWSLLGQSYGGFCAFTYLSLAPQGLRHVFVTGGTPPVTAHVDEVYAATYARIATRVERYYQRYPDDRARVRTLHEWLSTEDVRFAGGDRLTGRMLRQFGNFLGMSDGADRLHYLLELPPGSRAFRHDLDSGAMPFARNPIYAVLHEAGYGDGYATRWSAQRVRPAEYDADVTLLAGEHIYPWLFDDLAGLAPFKQAAHLLADREWGPLYDVDQLRRNEVPVAAVVYAEDPYVESRYSMDTAALTRGMRAWLTNEYDHDGLRADGERILDRLINLATGRA